MTIPKIRDENSDKPARRARQQTKTENSVGLRILSRIADHDLAWLAEKSAIPINTLRDYVQRGVAKAEAAVAIARALGVSVDWLLTGEDRTEPARSTLLPTEQADFEWVPRFDLRDVRDDGKGERVDETPMRKDWLTQRLGTSSELWLTAILSDYPALDLAEGDLVFCREAEPQELLNGQLILWRINQGIIVARYSVAAGAGQITMDGDNVVTAREVSPEQYVPIARILGKFMQRF